MSIAAQSVGRVIDEPVSGVDLPPTFFAQAGISLPWQMHGHDQEHRAVLEQFRAAAIAELKRTKARMVENLPPVGTF